MIFKDADWLNSCPRPELCIMWEVTKTNSAQLEYINLRFSAHSFFIIVYSCLSFLLIAHTSIQPQTHLGLGLRGFQVQVICNNKEWGLFLSLASSRCGVQTLWNSQIHGQIPISHICKLRSSAFKLWQIFLAPPNASSRWLMLSLVVVSKTFPEASKCFLSTCHSYLLYIHATGAPTDSKGSRP